MSEAKPVSHCPGCDVTYSHPEGIMAHIQKCAAYKALPNQPPCSLHEAHLRCLACDGKPLPRVAEDENHDSDKNDPLYRSLRSVLERAYRHASVGKGKERHASGEAFEDQPIVRFGEFMRGSIVFNVGQAAKKAMEAERLPDDRAIDELIGAINYLAGAVIIIEGRKKK